MLAVLDFKFIPYCCSEEAETMIRKSILRKIHYKFPKQS